LAQGDDDGKKMLASRAAVPSMGLPVILMHHQLQVLEREQENTYSAVYNLQGCMAHEEGRAEEIVNPLKSGPTLRRGTSDIALSNLGIKSADEQDAESFLQNNHSNKPLVYKDIIRKSLKMLSGNPEGSHVDDVQVHVKLDMPVGISCLAFGLLAAMYAALQEPFISAIMSLVTVTSTLSDAVVHGCEPLDILDRYVATLSAAAIAFYSFRWLQGEPSLMWCIAIPVQSIQLVTPLYFLAKSRALQIGSDEWRRAHALWHWAAVACAASASLFSYFCRELL